MGRRLPEYDKIATITLSALDLAHLKPKKKLSPRERNRVLAKAKELWEEGQREQAWVIIQDHGLFRSRTTEVRRFLAEVYAARTHPEKCLQQTNILIRKNPDTQILLLHGNSLLSLSREREAVAFLQPLIRDPSPQATNDDLKLFLLYFKALFEVSQDKALSLIPKVEEIIQEARRRGQEELFAKASFSLGTILRFRDPERALLLLDGAEAAYKTTGNWKEQAIVLDHKAFIHFLSRRLNEALRCYKKEALLHRKAQDWGGFGKCLGSIADVQMELCQFSRATLVLSKALALGPAQRLPPLLMLIECEWHLGADTEQLLNFLEEGIHSLDPRGGTSDSPFFHFLLSQFHWDLGHEDKARTAMQAAIKQKTQTGDTSFAAHYMTYLATMQDNRRKVRSLLAQILWKTRRDLDFTVDQLRRWVSGKPASTLPHTPFEAKEAKRIRHRLSWLLGPLGEKVPPKDWGIEMAKALSQSAAQGPSGILPLLQSFYGRIHLALLAQLPGGDWKPLLQQGMSIQEALSLEKGTGKDLDLDLHRKWKSHIRVSSSNEGLLLCIGSKNRFFHFGSRDVRKLRGFLDLLQPILDSPQIRWTPQEETQSRQSQQQASPTCPVLLGTSPSIREFKTLAERFASSELPITIQGETGTGKKTLASYLHQLSPRGKGALVLVDCASLQEGLIESELLGHVRGAFTGAQEDRPGQFHRAAGGSLVLINPAALSHRGQRLLLGAIESGGFRPLGGSQTIPLTARILCTSSQGLEKGLEEGTLQADLFYRLSGVTLKLPPLRERLADLHHLIQAMLQEERYPKPPSIPRQILAHLQQEPWPGNLRELRNRIKKALVLSGGEAWDPRLLLGTATPPNAATTQEALDLKSALKEFERQSLLKALAQHQGHRERTAQALGISRRWLQKRIRDLGL